MVSTENYGLSHQQKKKKSTWNSRQKKFGFITLTEKQNFVDNGFDFYLLIERFS